MQASIAHTTVSVRNISCMQYTNINVLPVYHKRPAEMKYQKLGFLSVFCTAEAVAMSTQRTTCEFAEANSLLRECTAC